MSDNPHAWLYRTIWEMSQHDYPELWVDKIHDYVYEGLSDGSEVTSWEA